MCLAVLGQLSDDHWVPNNPLVLDNPLINDDRQGGTCRAVSGKVLDDLWVLDDPLVLDD